MINGSRSDWGYFKPVISALEEKGHDALLLHCNMSCIDEYGNLSNELEKNSIKIFQKIYCSYQGGNHYSTAKMVASLCSSISDILFNNKDIDWVLLAGDRAEQIAAAIAASYMYVPIAHIQAGERSGNIDGIIRHSIGKMAHLHFASNTDAYNRLLNIGEQRERIILTGAPQLDDLFQFKNKPSSNFIKAHNLTQEKFVLCVYHPVTSESNTSQIQIAQLISALKKYDDPIVFIEPNNDAGALDIKSYITNNIRNKDLIFSNLNRDDYLELMYHCKFMIGNSSSGILEAPLFNTKVINIGTRQLNRVQSNNVANSDYDEDSILNTIQYLSSDKYIAILQGTKSSYGDEPASEKIVNTLEKWHRTKSKSEILLRDITC